MRSEYFLSLSMFVCRSTHKLSLSKAGKNGCNARFTFSTHAHKGGHNRPIFLALFEDDASCGCHVKATASEDVSQSERGSYGVDGTIENAFELFQPNDFS